ncbi:MAG TPA: GNAT family N-acetyltransferase [Pyrinomonadaceae bacterium]|nr:GNAT family N-acetyltransferase [Pyrinomonadaceae bacterium]
MSDSRVESIIYREATVADSPAVARVHVRSWRESFAGIVPQSFLDKMSVEQRTEAFAKRFSEAFYGMYVAEAKGRGVVGFADYGEPRDDVKGYEAELFAIYLLPEYQGRGVGKELFRLITEALVKSGKNSLYLLALEVSPYRSFYEKLGGRMVEHRPKEIERVGFDVVMYGWDRIR